MKRMLIVLSILTALPLTAAPWHPDLWPVGGQLFTNMVQLVEDNFNHLMPPASISNTFVKKTGDTMTGALTLKSVFNLDNDSTGNSVFNINAKSYQGDSTLVLRPYDEDGYGDGSVSIPADVDATGDVAVVGAVTVKGNAVTIDGTAIVVDLVDDSQQGSDVMLKLRTGDGSDGVVFHVDDTDTFVIEDTAGSHRAVEVAEPTSGSHAATKYYVDNEVITDHGGLSGLTDDDHSQYLLANGTRAMAGTLLMNTHNITGVSTPTSADHAANKGYVDTYSLLKTGGTMSGAIGMAGYNINLVGGIGGQEDQDFTVTPYPGYKLKVGSDGTPSIIDNVATPTASDHAATKGYVDTVTNQYSTVSWSVSYPLERQASALTIQLKDAGGNNLSGYYLIEVWLSGASMGSVSDVYTDSDSFTIGTVIKEHTASACWTVQSDSSGKIVLSLTRNSAGGVHVMYTSPVLKGKIYTTTLEWVII